jgi:hypothetical protein
VQVPDVQVEQCRAQRASLPQAYPHRDSLVDLLASEASRSTLVTLHNACGVLVEVLQGVDGMVRHAPVLQLGKQ